MLKLPVITLTTDFGLKDPFVGIMKGVILGINPEARIIDITHNIQRYNILEASRVIAVSSKYFPPATIHVVVVDPGVGGMRKPLLVVTGDHYFIGPDNGVFSAVYESTESDFLKVIHLTESHHFLPSIGSTFHGRDIFAPVAAWLSKGTDPDNFGIKLDEYTKLSITTPVLSEKSLSGEIDTIDNFGNAISNITVDELAKMVPLDLTERFKVNSCGRQIAVLKYYEENDGSSLSSIINSFGQLELFVFKGSAADRFNIKTGDKITVTIV
jgi:S-adenosylmethionine hydrolase